VGFPTKLTQISFAQDYYEQFTALANRVQGITQEVLLDCFVGGLEPNIGGMFLSKHQLHFLRPFH